MNSLGDLRSGSRLSLFSEMESGAIERGVQVGPELCTDSCRLVELLEVTNKSLVTASEKSVGKKEKKVELRRTDGERFDGRRGSDSRRSGSQLDGNGVERFGQSLCAFRSS